MLPIRDLPIAISQSTPYQNIANNAVDTVAVYKRNSSRFGYALSHHQRREQNLVLQPVAICWRLARLLTALPAAGWSKRANV
uniref:Outer membrane protein n=1 Tax=Ascaris lumbricoides TaxID=6252 RepID=A0A0M3HSP0_ASCLU